MTASYNIDIVDKQLSFEFNKFLPQSTASVVISCRDEVVLVTATKSGEPRAGINFFPLLCDFEEKLYAAGKIPGGFFKREGRPSENAVLSSRLIDRSLRPMFPKEYRNDVQIVATPLSVNPEYPVDVLAANAAAVALWVSEIPFNEPVATIRVGLKENGDFIIFPSYEEVLKGGLDLTVTYTKNYLTMIECQAKWLSEEKIISAISFGREYALKIIEFQEMLRAKEGKEKEAVKKEINEELQTLVQQKAEDEINKIIKSFLPKKERENKINELRKKTLEELKEQYPDDEVKINEILEAIEKKIVRDLLLNEGLRVDNRKPTEIRNITCEVGLLPRVHGSGLFTRGETQVLTLTTLGAVGEEQIIDGISIEESKRYMHQYNFPPYSVGEVKPLRGPGRREVGHGALAEKALEWVVPEQSKFPYTIRLVSEVLSSNGSTSMASVCGSTLSLMDAGVPLLNPVAGIAMGLMQNENKTIVLSDIQGIEDAFGDMDFKVAGTKDGITALQLDVKSYSLTIDILKDALSQAKEGRLFILDKILQSISKPREKVSSFAPRVFSLEIPKEKIGEVIGPGGKVIKKIIEETGVKIDIQDEGIVYITSPDEPSGELAMEKVKQIVREVEIGEIYNAKVIKTTNFGAFVELLPGKEALLHISEIDWERIPTVESVIKVGDTVTVKVIRIEDGGKIQVSKKSLLPAPESNKKDSKYRR